MVITIAPLVTVFTQLVNAALDHKSFENCWSKSLKDTDVDESLILSIKKTTEQQAMSGNTTTDGKKPSATDPANPFTEGIRDCMLQLNPNGSDLQALFKR